VIESRSPVELVPHQSQNSVDKGAGAVAGKDEIGMSE